MLGFTQFLAESEQLKQKQIQQSEVKKVKRNRREEINGKAAEKLGVSTEGKTKEEVTKEVNTARFEKRHDLLIEHAKQLGIDTEGKR